MIIDNSIKQVIVIRKDLKMRRGKEIAQGSHASMAFLLKNHYRLDSKVVQKWVSGGQTKVTLCVNSEEELLEIYNRAKENNLDVHLITDAGLTEFNGVPTKTCLAIGPDEADKINKITGQLKLY